MKNIRLNDKRIVVVVGVILLILLMADFNSRMSEKVRLNRERDTLRVQATQLGATRSVLLTQVAYATSDRAVEEYAREEAHLQKTGEVVIIPVAPVDSTPQPPLIAVPTPQAVQNWEVWYALFFSNP